MVIHPGTNLDQDQRITVKSNHYRHLLILCYNSHFPG